MVMQVMMVQLDERFLTTGLLPLGKAGRLGLLGDSWAKGRMISGHLQKYRGSRSFR